MKGRSWIPSRSAQIQRERNAYHDILEASQRGDLDITAWLEWYFACLRHAINSSHEILDAVLTKANFWQRHEGETFSECQRNLINRLLDGFDGKLTSSKWAHIAKCSPDTALRDITDLMERNILAKDDAGGRSTGYHLK